MRLAVGAKGVSIGETSRKLKAEPEIARSPELITVAENNPILGF